MAEPMKIVDAIRLESEETEIDIKLIVGGAVLFLHSEDPQDNIIGGTHLENFFKDVIHSLREDNPQVAENIIVALYSEEDVDGITILITNRPRSTKEDEDDFIYLVFDNEPAIGY
ncbi:hypothetical protein ACIQ1D_19120 [Lysinibacillus xylanilyticus]|uniref:hypothetical protein n=1 Tax=Lysinibacillus xylanilyticus TaxID=582475 RepID=UPI0038259228